MHGVRVSDEIAEAPKFEGMTPLLPAIQYGHEDIAVYLLSLPPGPNARNLTLGIRVGSGEYPLLTLAAHAGLVRVVEELLARSVDLLTRDAQGQVAVCRAVIMCYVGVVDVLLKAHASGGGDGGGVEAVVECPCRQGDQPYPLLFHAFKQDENPKITPDARLATVQCLVKKWGANVRALFTSADGQFEYYPIFFAAMEGRAWLLFS